MMPANSQEYSELDGIAAAAFRAYIQRLRGNANGGSTLPTQVSAAAARKTLDFFRFVHYTCTFALLKLPLLPGQLHRLCGAA